MDTFRIEKRRISVAEYQYLRHTTDWFQLDDETVAKSLNADLFSVCIMYGNRIAGMGRVVGDGPFYFYL